MSLASHGQWILWPGHPKQCQNHPGLAEGQPEGPLVQGNLAYQLKINTKKVFWPHKDSGFCGLATQNTAKIAQDWLKANLKDHWSKEIWPPSSKDCNPLVISCGANGEVNKQPKNTLASLKAMIPDVMANLDREVVIHVCKKFRSWIEADMEATVVFIK